MSAHLLRSQYYSNKELQDLFSKLNVTPEEIIGNEFDEILKLIGKRYRKLSGKLHPDKNKGREEQATKEFQELNAVKQKLEEYIKALSEGKGISHYSDLSKQEEKAKQKKIEIILSCRNKAVNRAIIYFLIADTIFNPSSKIKFCLSQLAAGNALQNIAYQFYAFSTGIWVWLSFISFIAICLVIYIKVKQGLSQEENFDRYVRAVNTITIADNCVICIAAALAVCSLASEIVQNGWTPCVTTLAVSLALDLLLVALFRAFISASQIYSEYCIQRLYEKDAEFNYKEKLAWYDYKIIFIPIVLPLVKSFFKDLIEEEQNTTINDPQAVPAGALGLGM